MSDGDGKEPGQAPGSAHGPETAFPRGSRPERLDKRHSVCCYGIALLSSTGTAIPSTIRTRRSMPQGGNDPCSRKGIPAGALFSSWPACLLVVELGLVHLQEARQPGDGHVQAHGQPVQCLQLRVPRLAMDDVLHGRLREPDQRHQPVDRDAALIYQIL